MRRHQFPQIQVFVTRFGETIPWCSSFLANPSSDNVKNKRRACSKTQFPYEESLQLSSTSTTQPTWCKLIICVLHVPVTLHITRISDSTLQGDNKLEFFKDMHHDLKLEEVDTRTGTDKAHWYRPSDLYTYCLTSCNKNCEVMPKVMAYQWWAADG